MTAPAIRIRIAVVTLPDGTWNASGWSEQTDASAMSVTWDGIEYDDVMGAREFWVEASLPIAVVPPAEVVEGEVLA